MTMMTVAPHYRCCPYGWHDILDFLLVPALVAAPVDLFSCVNSAIPNGSSSHGATGVRVAGSADTDAADADGW